MEKETQQYPLWARVMGSSLAYVFDNLLMLIAVVMIIRLNWAESASDIGACLGTAFAFMVFALYQRLTEIRDNLETPEVTMNFVTNKTEGENT